MELYHLGSKKFASQLTGDGAKLHGGRWNAIGTPCIYTSESVSLCVLEYAANVSLYELPPTLAITIYNLPEGSWKEFNIKDLPEEWNAVPAPTATQEWGTEQLQAMQVSAIKLPSIIIPTEYNYLLNPLHPEFKKIKIKEILPFTFDIRIKK